MAPLGGDNSSVFLFPPQLKKCQPRPGIEPEWDGVRGVICRVVAAAAVRNALWRRLRQSLHVCVCVCVCGVIVVVIVVVGGDFHSSVYFSRCCRRLAVLDVVSLPRRNDRWTRKGHYYDGRFVPIDGL